MFTSAVHAARRTTPDEHRLGARAARPRRGSAGTVTAPLPSPPPAGGRESGSSPQRGEVRRGGQRRMRVGEQPMFTLAVHAAPPHTDGMNIGSSWEGCALPNPPAGGRDGETRFPHPPASRPGPRTMRGECERRGRGNLVSPAPHAVRRFGRAHSSLGDSSRPG
jgi:hypothetical protein